MDSPSSDTPESPAENRLATESSAYLLQHKHNPVDWYPWGEEALERARGEDRPLLVSIGYSACHWCHVMERESFENEATAALMNRHFVCIKVDREERRVGLSIKAAQYDDEQLAAEMDAYDNLKELNLEVRKIIRRNMPDAETSGLVALYRDQYEKVVQRRD